MRFARYDVNHWKMFAPDIMHEFVLGVWKSTLTHLLRILFAKGNDNLQEIDFRYTFFTQSTVFSTRSRRKM